MQHRSASSSDPTGGDGDAGHRVQTVQGSPQADARTENRRGGRGERRRPTRRCLEQTRTATRELLSHFHWRPRRRRKTGRCGPTRSSTSSTFWRRTTSRSRWSRTRSWHRAWDKGYRALTGGSYASAGSDQTHSLQKNVSGHNLRAPIRANWWPALRQVRRFRIKEEAHGRAADDSRGKGSTCPREHR